MSHSFWANFLKMTWTLTQLSRSPLIHLTFWHCLTDFTIWIYEGYLCWNCRCWVQTRIKAVMNAHAALKDTGLLVVVANLMWSGSLTYWSHELLISRLKKRGGRIGFTASNLLSKSAKTHSGPCSSYYSSHYLAGWFSLRWAPVAGT